MAFKSLFTKGVALVQSGKCRNHSAKASSYAKRAVSYFRSFGLPIKIVRPFNIYGPRQSARAIIPTIGLQILNGLEEIKLGNLEAKRDLTFVKDTVDGFIAISNIQPIISADLPNIPFIPSNINAGSILKIPSKIFM